MFHISVSSYLCLGCILLVTFDRYDATRLGGSDYEAYYDEINSNLVDRVNWTDDLDNDIEANMAAVTDWLVEHANSRIGKRWLVRPLLRLKNLQSILNEEKCNRIGLTVLSQNDKAIRNVLHNNETLMRRVDKIVRYYAEKHATICRPIYKSRLVIERETINPGILSAVEAMTFSIINDPADQVSIFRGGFFGRGEKAIWQDEERNITRLIDILTGNNFGPMSAPYKLVAHLARDDPDNKYLKRKLDEKIGSLIVEEDHVVALFKRYILSPCQDYCDALDDTFSPASFDDRTIGFGKRKASGHYLESDIEEVKLLDQYYLSRASFEICRRALENGTELARLLIDEVSKDGLSYLI